MTQWQLIDELAAELGVSAGARRKWKKRRRVSYRYHVDLLALARSKRKPLDPESLKALPLEEEDSDEESEAA